MVFIREVQRNVLDELTRLSNELVEEQVLEGREEYEIVILQQTIDRLDKCYNAISDGMN